MKKVLFTIVALAMLAACSEKKGVDTQGANDVLIADSTQEALLDSMEEGFSNGPKEAQRVPSVFNAVPMYEGGEYLPLVDTVEIRDYNDYYSIKNDLYGKYYGLKNSAYGKYYNLKNAYYGQYYQKRQEALEVVREENYNEYLSWLDAKEMGDYDKQKAIEETQVFAHYNSVNSEDYAKYKVKERAWYTEYKQIEREAYAEYKRKERLAYSVYKRRN